MASLLEVKNLAFRYSRERGDVFKGISFTVEKGEMFTLLGPNGAGKSTLLNCIAGLAAPSEGSVLVNGEPVESYSTRTLAKHIGYVRQHIAVTYGYTVREYLAMGAERLRGFRRWEDAVVRKGGRTANQDRPGSRPTDEREYHHEDQRAQPD